MTDEARLVPCVSCGRSLRPRGTSILNFPGTLMSKSKHAAAACSTCHDIRLQTGKYPGDALPSKPLTRDDLAVIALVDRRVPDETERELVLSELGLVAT